MNMEVVLTQRFKIVVRLHCPADGRDTDLACEEYFASARTGVIRILNRFELFTTHRITGIRIDGDSRRGGWLPPTQETVEFIKARGLTLLTDYHTADAGFPDYPGMTQEQIDNMPDPYDDIAPDDGPAAQ